jgi:hypothetical protein
MARLTLSLLLVGMIVLSVIGIPRADAADPCSQWNVTGTWQISQGAYHPVVQLTQSGTALSGSGFLGGSEAVMAGYTSSGASGSVTGSINGDKFDITIAWQPKRDGSVSRGRYMGTVVGNQIVDGTGYDWAVGPQRSVPWTGTGTARCTSAPPPPAPTTVIVTPKVSCSVSGDLQVSGQEIADIVKFRSRPGVSQKDAESAVAEDIAALARSRGGSGSVECGGRSITVEAAALPEPIQDSCDVAIGRLLWEERETFARIKGIANECGVDLGAEPGQMRKLFDNLHPLYTFCIIEGAKDLMDRLDVVQALIIVFQSAREAGESCPALP